MVKQVNKYFVADSVADLATIHLDNLDGCKCFVKSNPSEEYIYTGGGWQLIAGQTLVTQIETAQTDITTKQDTLISGTNIKTINSTSLLGAGNIVISGGSLPDADYGDVTVSGSGTVMTVDSFTTNVLGTVVNGSAAATPNDTDLVMSVESSVAKKNTWLQIKGFLKVYFDAIYNELPTGTPDGTKYLRDDNTWQPVSGGSGLTQQQTMAIASFKI